MLITLAILAICILLGFAMAVDTVKHNKEKSVVICSLINSSIFSAIALTIFFGIFSGFSYSSYVDMRSFYDSTIEQYATAVEMYEDKAVIDIESAAWTDLKYQGYQDNVHELITNLRWKIVDYNENLISKRVMKRNLFFNWIIVSPDNDMKVLKMKTANQHLK